MRATPIALALLGLAIAACSGGSGTPPPPPTTATGPVTTPTPTTPPAPPPGQVMITVSAASVPPGATVTGGGQMLGTTPFTTQVPVPAPTPGAPAQTFQFTFQLPGFEATTLTASPVNSTISLNAVLASLTPPTPTPPTVGTTPPPPPGGAGGVLVVRGPPGGPIFDYHTTTSVAVVSQPCVIRSLRVDIDGSHTFNHDLLVGIRAPDGEAFSLQRHSARSPFRTHSVRRARGHLAMGRWTLSIEDTVGADSGTLRGWTLNIECM